MSRLLQKSSGSCMAAPSRRLQDFRKSAAWYSFISNLAGVFRRPVTPAPSPGPPWDVGFVECQTQYRIHTSMQRRDVTHSFLALSSVTSSAIRVLSQIPPSWRTIFERRKQKFSTYVSAAKALLIFSFNFRFLSAFIAYPTERELPTSDSSIGNSRHSVTCQYRQLHFDENLQSTISNLQLICDRIMHHHCTPRIMPI